MNNPYEAPQAALRDTTPAPSKAWDITHQVICLLAAVVCSLQVSAIVLVITQMWPIDAAYRTIVLGKLALPALLALSGILLAFRRTFAFYGFLAYFFASVIPNAWDSRVLSFVLLAYSFYLWRVRWLR